MQKPNYEEMIKALLKEYHIMDTMCHPNPCQWMRITSEDKYEVELMIKILKENIYKKEK